MPHECKITVRGHELDSFGHVNNAVYLNYFEQARWELLRSQDLFDYFKSNSLFLVVTEAFIRYSREAKVFDELIISTSVLREEPYLVYKHIIRNMATGDLIARGTIRTLLVDSDRIPRDVPDTFLAGS